MNYSGYEALRADVAALANNMCDLRTTLNELEQRYRFDSDRLTERLARQALRRINEQFLIAYKEILELDSCFKD